MVDGRGCVAVAGEGSYWRGGRHRGGTCAEVELHNGGGSVHSTIKPAATSIFLGKDGIFYY